MSSRSTNAIARSLIWLASVLSATYSGLALAGPVGEMVSIPILAERWKYSPGDPRLLPPPGRGALEFSYFSYNIYRFKKQDSASQLARIRGPALTAAFNDWRSFFSVEASDYAVVLQWSDDELKNRLDGTQTDLRFDFGTRIPLSGEERLVLACRFEQGNSALSGVLPSALDQVPGFSLEDDVSHGWDDRSWLASLRYEYPAWAWHASYGNYTSTPSLQALNPEDNLACRLPMSGSTVTGGLEFPIEQRVAGELFASHRRAHGVDRVYHHDDDIGLIQGGQKEQQFGVRIRDPRCSRSWDFSIVAGKYSATLAGSARLAGFDGSVWGITAPRGHLDAWLNYRAVTMLLDRTGGNWGDCDWRYNLGATRFDLDSRIETWGTVLFGSARIEESSRSLPLEAGWIGHAGISASWNLGGGKLTATVSQSLPISIQRTAHAGESLPAEKHVDGGRVISIAYTICF